MHVFALIGWDAPDSAALRQQHRPVHLEGLEALAARGQLRQAGPLLDAGGQPCGSLVIFEAESLDAARQFAATDPYCGNGVFERYEVHETRVVLPR
ncbi:MAG: hypothetical protein JRH16_14205 [Deltaproteobacteria bacterium]|nr:hypothetical protein [Deltaproteobacteria bacterium]